MGFGKIGLVPLLGAGLLTAELSSTVALAQDDFATRFSQAFPQKGKVDFPTDFATRFHFDNVQIFPQLRGIIVETSLADTTFKVQFVAQALYDVLKKPELVKKYGNQKFYVVIVPGSNNAFYCGNGRIEMGKVMADRLSNSQLAVILGHEIGHGINPNNLRVNRESLTLAEKRQLESEADDIGLELAIEAGFLDESIRYTFNVVGGIGGENSDHPSVEERERSTQWRILQILLRK